MNADVSCNYLLPTLVGIAKHTALGIHIISRNSIRSEPQHGEHVVERGVLPVVAHALVRVLSVASARVNFLPLPLPPDLVDLCVVEEEDWICFLSSAHLPFLT